MPNQSFGKTISDYNISYHEAKKGFSDALTETKQMHINQQIAVGLWLKKAEKLFDYAFKHDQNLFTSLYHNFDGEKDEISKDYFTKWINKFIKERLQPATEKKLKTYMEEDDALITRVAKVSKASNEDLDKFVYGHAIFMSAENFNGAMLEEYIAYVIEPIGWIWCSGSTYRAIDFCLLKYDDNEDNSVLLQVKNKYNTENSSSSAIRNGTTIKKWNRLNRPIVSDLSKPIPNWNELQQIIEDQTPNSDSITEELIASKISLLNEDSYLDFIKNKSSTEVQNK